MPHAERVIMTACSRRPIIVLLVATVAALLGGDAEAQPSVSAGSGLSSEFLRWCEELRPTHGAILARYRTPPDVMSEGVSPDIIFAWDVDSGAWFQVVGGKYTGRTPSGQEYVGDVREGPAHPNESPNALLLSTVAYAFPGAWLSHFVEHPELVLSAQQLETGGFRVRYKQWTWHQGPVGVLEFATDGRVLQRWQADDTDRRRERVRYDQRYRTAGLWAATGLYGARELAPTEVRVWPDGQGSRFDPDVVRELASDAQKIFDIRLRATAAGYTTDASGEVSASGAKAPVVQPYGGSAFRRWRVPVLVTGLVLLAIGGVEAWRRGRA